MPFQLQIQKRILTTIPYYHPTKNSDLYQAKLLKHGNDFRSKKFKKRI